MTGETTSGALRARCRAAGVDELLLGRAEHLRLEDQIDARADRFLELLVALVESASIPPPPINVGEILASDGERAALLELIDRNLDPDGDETDERRILRFLVEDRPVDDPDVVAFVNQGVRRALRHRGGGAQSRTKHFDHSDARAALLGARSVFEQHGKRFFLDRGTLLGAVREHGFIASDYDIDVGVFADEISLDELKAMFEQTDYELSQDESFKVGLLSPGGIQIDFFLTIRQPGYFLSKGLGGYHNWYFSPFDLMEYAFLGETFFVPATYEKHLDENYGNWRQPVIFYDLSYNEPCVAYGRTASAGHYQARRLRNALNSGDSYLARAASRVLADHFGFDYTDRFPAVGAQSVAPPQPSNRPVAPIVIVDEFEVYSHRVRRTIESALSLSDDVDLCVIADSSHPDATDDSPRSDRRVVAESIDRIRQVVQVAGVDEASLRDLLEQPVQAVILGPGYREVARALRDRADHTGCSVVIFDDDSVALDRDEAGRIFARPSSTAPPQSG